MWNGIQRAARIVAGLAAALAAVPTACGAGEVEITLDEAIERALEHNLELAQGAIGVAGAELDAERARETVRGFKVVPEGEAGIGGERAGSRAGIRAEATAPMGTKITAGGGVRHSEADGAADLRRSELRVEISQPLFRNFGALARNEPATAAGETWMAARRAWERDRSALALRVAEQYEGLIFLLHQIEGDEAFAGRMERLWALADARERQGKTTRTEVLRMDLQRGEAAVRLEGNQSRLEVQFREFADLLGMPQETAIRLTPPPLLDLALEGTDRAVEVALAERPDYAQALHDVETADRKLLLARRALLPDLRLVAGRTTYGEGEDWKDAGRLDQNDWFVGLGANVDLNMRGTMIGADRAALDAGGRRGVAEIVRRRLALEVAAAASSYRRSRAELRLAGQNRELAERRAELSRALFEAGRAGADTVSDAEADLAGAELAERSVRREASVAAYRMLHALGTLTPAPRELLRGGAEKGKKNED